MSENWERVVEVLADDDGWTTAGALADRLGVTARSIRTYVARANGGGVPLILSGPAGYRLDRAAWAARGVPNPSDDSPAARTARLIRSLIDADDGLDVHETAATLFVSESTIEADLGRIRARLEGTGLSLARRGPRVELTGPESARRRFLGALLREESARGMQSLEELRAAFPALPSFRDALVSRLADAGYAPNEFGLNDVLLHLAIALDRLEHDHPLDDAETAGQASRGTADSPCEPHRAPRRTHPRPVRSRDRRGRTPPSRSAPRHSRRDANGADGWLGARGIRPRRPRSHHRRARRGRVPRRARRRRLHRAARPARRQPRRPGGRGTVRPQPPHDDDQVRVSAHLRPRRVHRERAAAHRGHPRERGRDRLHRDARGRPPRSAARGIGAGARRGRRARLPRRAHGARRPPQRDLRLAGRPRRPRRPRRRAVVVAAGRTRRLGDPADGARRASRASGTVSDRGRPRPHPDRARPHPTRASSGASGRRALAVHRARAVRPRPAWPRPGAGHPAPRRPDDHGRSDRRRVRRGRDRARTAVVDGVHRAPRRAARDDDVGQAHRDRHRDR